MAKGGKRGRPRAHSGPPESLELPLASQVAASSRTTASQLPQTRRGGNETVTRTGKQASYASIVDPDEGTTLEFIPVLVLNGVKCEKVDVEDIEDEITYWQNAVICYLLGASPPISIIEGFIKRIWRDYAITKVV